MRTKFYTALGRLLFMDDGNAPINTARGANPLTLTPHPSPLTLTRLAGEGRFEAFMAPLLHTLQQIQASLGAPNAEVARRTIGIARDLRGLLRACNSSRTYRLVFEALYPTHLETIAKALHVIVHRVAQQPPGVCVCLPLPSPFPSLLCACACGSCLPASPP